MKRWIVALLVAAAVLILVAPGLIGRLAERDLQESVEQAGRKAPDITISTEAYDRGWFRSAGRHRIEFTDRVAFPGLARFVEDAGYDNMPALVFDSQIHHGPLPLTAFGEQDASFAPSVVKLVSSVFLDPGSGELIELPGSVYTSVGLDGSARAVIDLDEGEWSSDEANIAWQGADFLVTADQSGELTSASGFLAPLRLSAGNDGIQSERIDIEFEQRESVHGLMLGSLDLKSGPIRSTGPTGDSFGFASADISAHNRLDDGRVSGSSRVDVREIGVPGIGQMSIGLDFVFDGFEAEPLGALIAAYDEGAAGGDPQQGLARLYPEYDAELQQLLGGGGELRFERLDVSFPAGTLESDLTLTLPETSTGAFSWPGLILKLTASINLRMPVPVFDMLQATYPDLNSAVGMGFLVKDGDDYTMQVKYAQGLATVNGMPMPVPLPGS